MKRFVIFLLLFIVVTFFNSVEVTLYHEDIDSVSVEGDTYRTHIVKSTIL